MIEKQKFNYGKTFVVGFGFFAVMVAWSVYNSFVPHGQDRDCVHMLHEIVISLPAIRQSKMHPFNVKGSQFHEGLS